MFFKKIYMVQILEDFLLPVASLLGIPSDPIEN